ncbi:MAG: response regulator [Lachnospiraceae bacterium]|nr:response regulator [Lachnospiraceae bacterium]
MRSSEKLIGIVKIIFIIVFAASFVGLYYFGSLNKSVPMESEPPIPMEEWTVTDPEGNVFSAGSTYRNSTSVKGTFTAVSTLPREVKDEHNFSFVIGGDAAVYINGELRKDFIADRDVVVPGGCVKRFYMMVPLYHGDSGAEIKIERINTTRRGYVYQDTMVVTPGGLNKYLMSRYWLSFVLSEQLLVFSFVIVLISIALRVLYKQRIVLLYGAMSIFVISVWLVTNSYLFPFAFGHYHIDGVLNYMMCLLMPFNLIFYVDSLQHGRYRRIMKDILILATVNLIVWPVLHFSGTLSFPDALIFIDFFLAVEILIVMGVLVADAAHGNMKEHRYIGVGIAGFLVCGFLEVLTLTFSPSFQDDIAMLIGMIILLTLAVVQQMHELRALGDERQRAVTMSEAKTKFLASMSHEIRTPINAVLGMNEMILRENKDPVINEYARSVRSSGKMLLMLVNDILDFSKIEAGKMEITNIKYRLSGLLRDIMPMLKERADEKSLDLSTLITDKVPDGQISDEFRIRQILINLINNAIKYTDSGKVTLIIGGNYLNDEAGANSEKERFMMMLGVRDTGRGISEEGQKHLFEAFSRADLNKNGNIEGTGLGLAIVKNIVDSMGGEINVISKLGEGSEFIIHLPVRVSDKEPLSEDFMDQADIDESGDAGSDYQAPDAAILAVDDNNSNLKIVKLFLKRVGIVPDTCDSGRKAIALCKSRRYDLIILDHRMPELDGLETLRIIRSDEGSANKETPAVVLTANAVAGSRQIYMEAGFADYLTKPIDSALLEKTVRTYLPEDKVMEIWTFPESGEVAGEAVSGQTEEKTGSGGEPRKALKERLVEIPEMDYEVAIGHAGNNEVFLEELIGDITGECEGRVGRMKKALEDNDLERYQLEAHTIKGQMATIGFASLSERAGKHEQAATGGNREFINEDSGAFLAEYSEICKKLILQELVRG